MKKIIIALLAIAMLLSVSACKSNDESDSDKITIVSTIFPYYDFANQICGENAQIIMLLPPGGESHSYEPTPQDIKDIQSADLFIYTGGESDTWIDDIMSSFEKPVNSLKAIEKVDALDEEHAEGMEGEEEEEEEHAYDEHIWTSPKNAALICNAIQEEISRLDEKNAETYKANCESYVSQITAIDNELAALLAEKPTLIFGDRFPFLYFAKEFGLDYYAAFPGCSTQTEASAATIAFLIDKVKTQDKKVVFYIEFSNHQIADSIAEAAGAQTAMFHSCHNVTSEQLVNGVTYVSLMQSNLQTLKTAFGEE